MSFYKLIEDSLRDAINFMIKDILTYYLIMITEKKLTDFNEKSNLHNTS